MRQKDATLKQFQTRKMGSMYLTLLPLSQRIVTCFISSQSALQVHPQVRSSLLVVIMAKQVDFQPANDSENRSSCSVLV
jgi:hypothetical protein